MENELALKLYNHLLELKGIELNSIQSAKFEHACQKAIIENPKADFQDLILVSKIYLNYILDFPEVQL